MIRHDTIKSSPTATYLTTVRMCNCMAENMREKATRLTDGQRWAIRIAGILITLLAAGLIVYFFSNFFSLATGAEDPESFRQNIPLMFGLFALGGVCMMVGTFLLRLGFLRPFSEIVATEAEGALHSAGRSLGKGWSGGQESHKGQDVRIRCRECGALERESAKFCSSCGKPL